MKASAALACALLIVSAPAVHAESDSAAAYIVGINQMVAELGPESARAALTIRESYLPFLDYLVLNDYGQIESALDTGGLALLPPALDRFNVTARLEGANPIGEKDLAHQESYLAARPAAIGCLLEIASRVTSGPVEVTSLVRHREYQDALRMTNSNATTTVPTHTMGVAFDIALVNTPLETVYEIRDVLRQMSEAGHILFISEHRQLVFHVVPHPSRLGYFTEVYARALRGEPPSGIFFDASRRVVPIVTTQMAALRPTVEFESEWWAAEGVPVDLIVEVTPDIDPQFAQGTTDYLPPIDVLPVGGLDTLGRLLTSTWDIVTRWTAVFDDAPQI